jgi:hypothetical protein
MEIICKQVLPIIDCSCIKLWPVFRVNSFHYTNLCKLPKILLIQCRLSGDKTAALTGVEWACARAWNTHAGKKFNLLFGIHAT